MNAEIRRYHKTKLKQIADQVIVITGATSWIGLVTARMAAAKGAKVVLAARNEAALKELADELRRDGLEAAYVRADVGLEDEVSRIAEAAKEIFGRFDTWVNNAGVGIYGGALDVQDQDMKRLFITNFWGMVYGSRVAVRHYTERGVPGAVVNVGSISGDKGTPYQAAYAASKSAMHGWMESLRMELEKEGAPVSVTVIHPARIDTPYNEHARSYFQHQPVHRGMIYPPEAVAEAILFAAANRKRDIYVGSQAKAMQMLSVNFPSVTDKLWEIILPRTQYDKSRQSNSPEESGLYHSGYGMHERGTNLGYKRKRSMYVKAVKHPVLTKTIIVVFSVWALTKILKRNRFNK